MLVEGGVDREAWWASSKWAEAKVVPPCIGIGLLGWNLILGCEPAEAKVVPPNAE